MSVWSRSRTAARLPLPALSLLVALVMVVVIACGGEDDPAAQPAATSTSAAAAPTATIVPAATATTMPAAPTKAATATTASSYDDYSEPTEAATKEPMDEPTAEPMGTSEDVTIPIQGFKFQPAEITVTVGTTITWTNMDSAPHSATADDGSFNTGVLNMNESGSVTFDTPGTFTYFCVVHPNMTATVIVTN